MRGVLIGKISIADETKRPRQQTIITPEVSSTTIYTGAKPTL